jgi:transposase
MSTSLLYHSFGIMGYRYVHTRYEEGRTIFRIDQDPTTFRCPACGSRRVIRKGQMFRRFMAVPIGKRPVLIEFGVQRVQCLVCNVTRQVKIGFAEENKRFTKQFERYVIELSQHMTILDVARHLQVSWDVIKDIQKRNLKRRFSRPKLKDLTLIAIDEITIGHGHQYLTVVLDLRSGAVVFVGEGRGTRALEPFWKRLKASRARIQAVAMDMSNAYINAVSTHLPEAIIVFDHFHVIKLYNDRLAALRRDVYREATDLLQKKVLKGTRWLLLKNPENLDEKRNERQRLQEALRLNEPLACGYYMKEDLRLIWKQHSKADAAAHLDDWISRAEASGIRILKDFAKTLQLHRQGILAYYDYPISTGPLEGTNNKIKTMQRQAYGFRDREFFILKIYALHTSRYALVG